MTQKTHTHCVLRPTSPPSAHGWDSTTGQSVWDAGREPWGTDPGFLGARNSWYSQTPREVLILEILEARGVQGARVVLLVQGLLPSHSPQEHQWGRGLPCFPAQVENDITLGHQGGCQLNLRQPLCP